MIHLIMWLCGYRRCSACRKKSRDVRRIVERVYDDLHPVGWLCFDCFADMMMEQRIQGLE